MPHHEDRARTASETAMRTWQPQAAPKKKNRRSSPVRPVRLFFGFQRAGSGSTPKRTGPLSHMGLERSNMARPPAEEFVGKPILLTSFFVLVSAGIRAWSGCAQESCRFRRGEGCNNDLGS
ncbi:hypothetical protein LZ31DRAFT_558608 [Colletotrichum somersetense]|nr:hypothetical protein LZ31DRAFT_558608 [Colletotrichum somersetense]